MIGIPCNNNTRIDILLSSERFIAITVLVHYLSLDALPPSSYAKIGALISGISIYGLVILCHTVVFKFQPVTRGCIFYPSWTPSLKMQTETSEFEHSYYIGNYMGAILYGLELAIYGMILHRLFRKGNQSSPKSRRFCVVYSTVMIILSTINVSCNAIWGEEMWITHRNDPGGVPEFIETQITVWYETLASTAVISCIFMGDGLLLYRLFFVYGRSYTVLALPALAYMVALGLAIAQVVISGLPHGNFFGGQAAKVAVSYYVITVCLNIVLTTLICGRLIRVSKYVSNVLGKENAKVYTSAAAILVESAALYSVFGIMYLVPYALESPVGDLFGQLWTKISVISPLLIILRVVQGRAWTADVISRTSLEFVTSNTDIGSMTLAESNGRGSHICSDKLESTKSSTSLV